MHQLGSVNFNLTSGIQTFHDVRVGGALTVAGALTFEDVTNIDSVGIITAQSHVSIADSILHTGDTDTSIRFPAANTFTVETAGSEALRVTSAGDVGIGDNAPNSSYGTNLSVHSTATDGARLKISDGTTGKGNTDGLDIISTGGVAYFIQRENADMAFSTNNSEAFRVDSSQRLLVNTTSAMETFGSAALQVATAAGGTLVLGRNDTSVSEDNGLGAIYFDTKAGGSFAESAVIAAEADAAQDSGDYPSRLVFKTTADGAGSVTERLRIDSSGRLLIGTSSSRDVGQSTAGLLQVEATDATAVGSITRNSNSASGPVLALGKSRGTSNGSNTVVQSGDNLGLIYFAGADGTDSQTVAGRIQCQVDGTPGSNDMPGRLIFSTTADGASSPTERLRIDSSGRTLIGSGAISSPKSSDGGFDVCSHNLSIVFGGSSLSGTTPLRANNATKDGRIAAAHYTNSEEPVGVVRVISNSTENQVYWGGGSSIINAATDHRFYTASTNTTTGGTERFRILAGGQVNVAGNFTQTTYTMQVTGTFNATSNITQNGNALATNGKAIAMALIFG